MSYSQLKGLGFRAAEAQMCVWCLGPFATVLYICNPGSKTLDGKVPLQDNRE